MNSANRDNLASMKFSVLDSLCSINSAIDRIVREERGTADPRIQRVDHRSIRHHVHAIAGYLSRTHAHGITMQVGGIIVEARRMA